MTRNIFTNKTYLKARIRDDKWAGEMRKKLFEQTNNTWVGYQPCTWAWGCLKVPHFWAGSLMAKDGPVNNLTIPLDIPPGKRNATIFVTNYLCPKFRVKAVGNLIVSVFSGTFGWILQVGDMPDTLMQVPLQCV